MLLAIAMIQRQTESGVSTVENAYPRAVRTEGNLKAQEIMQQVFDVVDSRWRGLGMIDKSGLRLKNVFKQYDAAEIYAEECEQADEIHGRNDDTSSILSHCMCADILKGCAQPTQCPQFGKSCTPKTPVGPCMVSQEGTCHNWHRYRGITDA